MSIFDNVLLVGNYKVAEHHEHYVGIREAIVELGGNVMRCDWQSEPYLDRHHGFSFILHLDYAGVHHLSADNRVPKALWLVDREKCLKRVPSLDVNHIFTVVRGEVEMIQKKTGISTSHLTWGVRTRDKFPERNELNMIQFILGAVPKAHFVSSFHPEDVQRSQRDKVMLELRKKGLVHLFPDDGKFNTSAEAFEFVRTIYKNNVYRPCINYSSDDPPGATSNRFFVILQEGGFMISVDKETHGFHSDIDGGDYDVIHFMKDHPSALRDSIVHWSSVPKEGREMVARNGFEFAQKHHRYTHRLKEMEVIIEKQI